MPDDERITDEDICEMLASAALARLGPRFERPPEPRPVIVVMSLQEWLDLLERGRDRPGDPLDEP